MEGDGLTDSTRSNGYRMTSNWQRGNPHCSCHPQVASVEGDGSANGIDEHRTSTQTWLNLRSDKAIRELTRRVEALVKVGGLPICWCLHVYIYSHTHIWKVGS